jgi:hypothetical protein
LSADFTKLTFSSRFSYFFSFFFFFWISEHFRNLFIC